MVNLNIVLLLTSLKSSAKPRKAIFQRCMIVMTPIHYHQVTIGMQFIYFPR